MKGKIFALLFFGILFYILFRVFGNMRNDEVAFIKEDYKLTKGIIVSISNYKGKHLKVKYIVNKTEYTEDDGFVDLAGHEVGDSIVIKYSQKKPELILSELNENF